VLWDLVEDAARRVADEVVQQTPTAKVWTYAVDVSKAEVVAEKAQQVLREVGFVAILINNAVRDDTGGRRGWPLKSH